MEEFDEDVQPEPGDKPLKFEPLVVTASNGDSVTIHDYVSAVHPWLTARREQIPRAKHVADDEYTPGTTDEKLLVSADNADLVSAQDEKEWLATLRRAFERKQAPPTTKGLQVNCQAL
ncbi:hypothetical protein MMYC01_209620 [Madurella mycetomatis]|uniref:Uncharacterized protein n=1 Tax=Madurella mycetomatis TaxID=100816 RepID=A0A175VUJ0_9PEZI|nr:hypothetical protein MMYC01_209620 [Madurella mycetomatis]